METYEDKVVVKVSGTITFSKEWLAEYELTPEDLTPEKVGELVIFPFQEFDDHLVTAMSFDKAEVE